MAAVRRSRALHGPFVAPPGTPAAYAEYLQRARRPMQISFFVVERVTDELIGVVGLHDIVRDSRACGSLGYYAFEPFAGRGLMRAALELVITHAFRSLDFYRLEASIQPANTRSVRLIEGLGFRRDDAPLHGLRIRGRWRDHRRWSLLEDDWLAVSPPAAPRPRIDARPRHAHPSNTASTADVSTSNAAAAARKPPVKASSAP